MSAKDCDEARRVAREYVDGTPTLTTQEITVALGDVTHAACEMHRKHAKLLARALLTKDAEERRISDLLVNDALTQLRAELAESRDIYRQIDLALAAVKVGSLEWAGRSCVARVNQLRADLTASQFESAGLTEQREQLHAELEDMRRTTIGHAHCIAVENQLRAELAAAQAERDEAREANARSNREWLATAQQMQAERDEARMLHGQACTGWLEQAQRLTGQRDAARREAARMRPMVETAKVWREEYREWLLAPQIASTTGRHVLPANDGRLAAAIDTLVELERTPDQEKP